MEHSLSLFDPHFSEACAAFEANKPSRIGTRKYKGMNEFQENWSKKKQSHQI